MRLTSRPRLRPAVVVALVAPALLGAMSAAQAHVLTSGERQHVAFGALLGYNLASWYLWAALAPLVVALARRFPLDGAAWRRSLPLQLTASVVVGAAHALATTWFVWLAVRTVEEQPFTRLLVGSGFLRFHVEVVIYWAILGASLALDYQRKYRDRAVQASTLAAELAQAHLRALRMQLHPHFLFNTLHAITVLVDENPPAARRMIARLGELLRRTLAARGADEVPLGAELEFLRLYLEIEETRFQDRLRVAYEVAPETLDAAVPDLLLQPLVENAIKHAVSARTAPVRVAVRARRVADRLELRVEDDGPGVSGAVRDGIGLSTTRERLARLYGDDARLTLASARDGRGALATIVLPFRAAAVPDDVVAHA